MTDQPEKLDLNSLNISEEKRRQLLDLFPEARTEDGKIDFERLKLALGETIEVGKERYGMNWPGKADCFNAIQMPSRGTLLPCPEQSVNFDTSENLIIEGDNLEVLKLLQKSYLGKVKMIYIDPPYNTGNDFVYPDDFSDSLKNYQQYTGQVDAQGRKFGTNTDADGRFHSRWMNMMYPRLYLARNLLREDGVIFISIDDNEVSNLRKICDEIFGEENFIANIVWNHTVQSKNDEKYFSRHHNQIITYRNSDSLLELRFDRTKNDNVNYANPDNDPKGLWRSGDVRSPNFRASLRFSLKTPSGKIIVAPENGWRWNLESIQKKIADGEIIFSENETKIIRKIYLSNQEGRTPENLWLESFAGSSRQANSELKELFSEDVPFDTPKPTQLIKRMLSLATSEKKEIFLDFFAGSGTLAQAVLELNKEDSGNRKFILVQLPEPTGREDYPTIAEITKERVRRVIKKLNDSETGQLPLEAPQDRGFRVFKLDASNFKPWNASAPKDAAALAHQLELHVDHIIPNRSQQDILFEILLKSGFALTTPIETLNLAEKQVFSIAAGELLVCLEPVLTLEVIRAMAALKPQRVVCLDAGFAGNDQLKANAVQIFNTQGITSFKTV